MLAASLPSVVAVAFTLGSGIGGGRFISCDRMSAWMLHLVSAVLRIAAMTSFGTFFPFFHSLSELIGFLSKILNGFLRMFGLGSVNTN